MDNSGNRPLQVPGLDNDIPLDFQLPANKRFAHGFNEYKQTPAITARELGMLEAMNWITGKTHWDDDVFDDVTTAQWREHLKWKNYYGELLDDDDTWAWCVAELQDKAIAYAEKHFVSVLDAGSCVCKSDELRSAGIDASLREALEPLKRTSAGELVDPYLFPLVYGETHVLQDGGVVELHDTTSGGCQLRFSSSASVPSQQHEATEKDFNHIKNNMNRQQDLDWTYARWSWDYQMLPCEVAFVGDTGHETRISSYINNLHPSHRSVYRGIEKIISASIEPWNTCLIRGAVRSTPAPAGVPDDYDRPSGQVQRGRIPLRIVTFGASWKNELSLNVFLHDHEYKTKLKAYLWAKEMEKTDPSKVLKLLDTRMSARHIARRWRWMDKLPALLESIKDSPGEDTHREPMYWEHPKPGKSFPYKDWTTSRKVDRAVVDMIVQRPGREYVMSRPTHQRYEVNLAASYREKGLQVVVQISSIDLSKYADDHSGLWQLGGMLNDHIVAMSIFPYDVSNIRAKISFRQNTPMDSDVYRWEDDNGPAYSVLDDPAGIKFRDHDHITELEALAEVFGFENSISLDSCLNMTTTSYQETGHVRPRQAKLITWPNTLEHRLEASRVDADLAGYFRYVQLYLVDPNYRICSTRNVPPQRADWSSETVIDSSASSSAAYNHHMNCGRCWTAQSGMAQTTGSSPRCQICYSRQSRFLRHAAIVAPIARRFCILWHLRAV